MSFSSINRYIIILKWLGRVQLFPSCYIYHFDTHSTSSVQYKSHAFPLRGVTKLNLQIGLLLPTLILVSAVAPCLLAMPGSCVPLTPDGRGATPSTKGHIPAPGSSLEETHGPSSDWRISGQTGQCSIRQSQLVVPVGWEYHHHAVQDQHGRVRKNRNKNTIAKQMQPGLLIFFILRGLMGALSVEPELLPGPSLRGTRTQTWTHLTHAAVFRNRSDILPLLH